MKMIKGCQRLCYEERSKQINGIKDREDLIETYNQHQPTTNHVKVLPQRLFVRAHHIGS